jgi:class 3 adenylate cyclase
MKNIPSISDISSYSPSIHSNLGSSASPLAIRMGICSGPCIGGVLGTTIPRFHLFGDAMDMAIAIEQNGTPNECLVADSTYEKTYERFAYKRDPLFALNDMNVYCLKGKITS